MKKFALIINLLLACTLCGVLCGCGETEGVTPPEESAYAITLQQSASGSISCEKEEAYAGDTVTVISAPDEGYELSALYVNGEKTEGLTFQMPAGEVTLRAEFIRKQYAVQTVAIGAGSVSALQKATFGERVTVAVTPEEGAQFTHLLVNGVEVYGESFLMPKSDVTVTAVFEEREQFATSELWLTCATCNSYSVIGQSARAYEVAQSRWFVSYGDSGVTVRAQVTDENLYSNNSYINLEKNDTAAFYIRGENAQPLYVAVNADGEYLLTGNLSPATYGKDVYARGGIASEEKNGFTGYYTEVYLSYGLLGITDEQAEVYVLPKLINAGVQNGGGSAISEAVYGDVETLSDYALVARDGSFVLPEKGETYTFIGDSYFDVAFWSSWAEEFEGYDAFNIAIGGTTVKQWLNSVNSVYLCNPDKLVVHVGVNDLNRALLSSREGKDTATDIAVDEVIIGDLKQLFTDVHAVLPQTDIYFVSVCKMPGRSDNYNNVAYINNAIQTYASATDYLTYIDTVTYVSNGSGTPLNSFYGADAMHLERLGYAVYSREIKKALGFTLAEGETFGSNGNYASTYGFDFSKDNGENATVSQTGGGTQYACLNTLMTANADIRLKITVKDILNGDPYPKFGFFVCTGAYMLSFYVECTPSITATSVGAVTKSGYKDYAWTNTQNASVSGMEFANGKYVTLHLSREGANFMLYVNGKAALTVIDSTIKSSAAVVGLFSFNTAFEATDYDIEIRG